MAENWSAPWRMPHTPGGAALLLYVSDIEKGGAGCKTVRPQFQHQHLGYWSASWPVGEDSHSHRVTLRSLVENGCRHLGYWSASWPVGEDSHSHRVTLRSLVENGCRHLGYWSASWPVGEDSHSH
ncbi:hypothetical protein RRG08_019980 [Elysia crispata]|uniref:Uncharacterized protein n=1 Tax=Elysia crispata TaxID=231223 RepID=A0AAE1BBC0_9GAST|nr:hypothetical protein RRG08_019980 [Elysia crispata]